MIKELKGMSIDKPLQLGIRLRDNTAAGFFDVREINMLINGSELEDPEGDNVCYLAIFQSQTKQDTTWLVGNVFMRDYYVIYDMTPSDEQGKDYNSVSLA